MRSLESHSSDDIASSYIAFADHEAKGRSPLSEEICRSIATDAWTFDFPARLPAPKRQPNLLLASVRHVGGTVDGWREFRDILVSHSEAVAAVMLTRSTQTNEPGRCATLLPVLARLPQPIALLEVGASAGLCLIPDRYGYSYGEHLLMPTSHGTARPSTFSCRVNGNVMFPQKMPHVVWRAGIDLSPINVNDRDQVAWLETLVWPEQEARLANLRSALEVVR